MRRIFLWFSIFFLLRAIASYGDINGPYRDGFIEGYVKHRWDKEIQIEEYDGTLHQLPLADGANLVIDNVPVSIKDFKAGMEVYGKLRGKRLVYLEGYSTENPGYIPPGGKRRIGTVKKIDRDQIVLKTATGREETYFTSPATIVLKKGQNMPLSTLYEGDRVKLYFDEIDTPYISRMEIEGDSILVKDLYRGKIAMVDALEDEITLADVEVLRNGRWQPVHAGMKISYDADLPLYVGSHKLSYKNLKYYKGKTVYMAIKDFFGTEKIEKMVIKNQYESTYSDKITDINWYTQEMELKNHQNLFFHEGTIIIKNGRLVDSFSIHVQSDAFVVADGRGSQRVADVIYLYEADVNPSNIGQHRVYAGRLDTILQDQVILKDFFLLNHHAWESFREEKELYYDQDTMIFDLEEMKAVTPQEFYAEDYAVDEDTDYAKDKNLKDWYGYLYTDGDRICTMVVQKSMDSLLPQRITNGIAETVGEDSMVGWTVNVRDAKDWSRHHEKWMAKNTTLRINLEKAMIIKDGRMITPEEIQTRDRLYIIRDDFIGKIVMVFR